MTHDTEPLQPPVHLRLQKLCVLRRNGKYWLGGSGWTDHIEMAKVFPENQMESRARIDIGMPCEMIYVAPAIIEATEPVEVGGAQSFRKARTR